MSDICVAYFSDGDLVLYDKDGHHSGVHRTLPHSFRTRFWVAWGRNRRCCFQHMQVRDRLWAVSIRPVSMRSPWADLVCVYRDEEGSFDDMWALFEAYAGMISDG